MLHSVFSCFACFYLPLVLSIHTVLLYTVGIIYVRTSVFCSFYLALRHAEVSMDGWWQCCQCSEKVFSNWHGVECISCSHGYCRYCYNLGSTPIDSGGGGYTGTLATEDLDVAITASAGMPLASSDTLLHIRPTARHLPIYIHDYLVNACADSGSQVNCITEDYAKHLGATVKRNV